MRFNMNKEQLIKIVSLYQEDIPELKVTDLCNTVTISNNNITATFITTEMGASTVHEVLNHIVGVDYDDNDEDVFRVILPESLNHLKIDEKITVFADAATLTASADFNGMIVELYSIFIVGSRRSITFSDIVMVDNISRFETWFMPEFKCVHVAELIAKNLSNMKYLTPDNFRNIELLNGSKSAIENCIKLAENLGGELFHKLDLQKRECVYGYNRYSEENRTFEPYLEFHTKW